MRRTGLLPFALPDLDGSELAEITTVLEAGWITTGGKTKQFETEFAAVVGARHAIAVNSCTAAMHLSLEAIGVRRGDEVITTAYTFAASAEIIRYFDARPVFVDVDARTLNMRPDLLHQAISRRTRAIIPVHVAGLSANMDAIHDVARQYGLHVIEDAAHAFPAAYNGRMIGTLSDFTCFSFYATKTITTGEGGMICTESDEWAERCRVMRLHGISSDAWKRYGANGSWYYEIAAPGFKYNMPDLAAALGVAQLRRADRMWQRRCEIAEHYNQAFDGAPELQIPAGCVSCKHAWHLYILRLNLDMLSISRAQFIEELRRRNIGTSVHFIPLHLHPYYYNTYGYRPEDFPVALREYERAVSLPIYSKMSDGDVQDVIASVLETVESCRVLKWG